MKAIAATECGDDIPKPVVAPVTAPLLEAGLSRGDVELVVGYEYFFRRYPVEIGHGGDRFTTTIHKCCRDQQAHIMSTQRDAGSIAKKLAFSAQADTGASRQLQYKKGTRIVAGAFIFLAWIAKPDDEPDLSHEQTLAFFAFFAGLSGLATLGRVDGCDSEVVIFAQSEGGRSHTFRQSQV